MENVTETKIEEKEGQPNTTPEAVVEATEADESSVLNYFKSKGKEFDSVENMFKAFEPQVVEKEVEKIVEKEIELPEDVSSFYKYKKETGRSMQDYLNLQKDYKSLGEDQVLVEYYMNENPAWTKEDALDYVKENFGFDEDEDTESVIKSKNRNKKTEVFKAIEKLESLKSQYSTPAASAREKEIEKNEDDDDLDGNEYQQALTKIDERNQKVSDHFQQKKAELFTPEFKGFEFNVGLDNPIVFKVENPQELASDEQQSIKFFLDDEGMLKNPELLHEAIYYARNKDLINKHIYDQGVADAIKQADAEAKNVSLNPKITVNQTRDVPPGTVVSMRLSK